MADTRAGLDKCTNLAGCFCGGAHGQGEVPTEVEGSCPSSEPVVRQGDGMPERCGECLRSLTHRLSQPMTALRGIIELILLSERTAGEYRGALEQSLEQTDGIIQLIISLREFAESTAAPGFQEHVLFGELAQQIQEELHELAVSAGVQTEFEGTSGLYVLTDPDLLRQVLLKIYESIIRSTPPGGSILFNVLQTDGRACLRIHASGSKPLPREVLRECETLTPGAIFSQGAKANGLGWIIQKRSVEALGGTLEITSNHSQTLSLRICFPLEEQFFS